MHIALFAVHYCLMQSAADLNYFYHPQCLPWKLALVKPRSSASLVVNTTYPTHFQVKSENNGLSLCKYSTISISYQLSSV